VIIIQEDSRRSIRAGTFEIDWWQQPVVWSRSLIGRARDLAHDEQPTQNWYGQGESDCLIQTKHCDGVKTCSRNVISAQCSGQKSHIVKHWAEITLRQALGRNHIASTRLDAIAMLCLN
jgi:hypothetical protein